MFYRILLGILVVFTMASCQVDSDRNKSMLVIRFDGDPDRLNPVISTNSSASQIENMIFQPLAELDPLTLNFEPILLDKIIPPIRDDFNGLPVERIDLKLKDDAVWDNGSRVTHEDILFTLKTIFNDEVDAARKKTIFSFLKGEQHEANDPSFISFYLDTSAFNADKIIMNFHIMPRYVYDSSGLMTDISLNQLIDNNLSTDEQEKLKTFADQFHDSKYSQTTVQGSGAYKLENWNAGYEIQLTRKADWWGEKYNDQNLFKAIPEQLIYKIIPDQQLAITAMANDNVDIITGLSPEKFSVLKETSADDYEFLTPVVPRYFYIMLNNEYRGLDQKLVRQALAHLVDQPKLIEVVMGGFGQALTAPLLAGGKYTDPNIAPYPFDVSKATKLLKDAGWSDSDDDGTVDMMIDDEHVELELRLHITGSALSRQIGLLLKNNFEQAGIDLELVAQKFSQTLQEMRVGNFEMVATAPSSSLHDPILKPSWHSTSIGPDGGNYSRFSNENIDRILDELEMEENQADRLTLYREFHRAIHEEVPVLFLLMPTERILVNKPWHLDASPRRPGYFENLAYRKE